jgi:hypothetical protein
MKLSPEERERIRSYIRTLLSRLRERRSPNAPRGPVAPGHFDEGKAKAAPHVSDLELAAAC